MPDDNALASYKLTSPQTELQLLYNSVLDNYKLFNTFTPNDIIHALANLTNVTIDLKKMQGNHRTQLIKDSITVLTSPCYNPEHMTTTQLTILCKAAGKALLLKGLTPAKRNNLIQDCISVIRNTQSIPSTDSTLLQQLATITGVFLPRGALKPQYKHSLASSLIQALTKSTFDESNADLNSLHAVQTYLFKFNPNISYKQDDSTGTLHPYLLNRQISIVQRRQALLDEATSKSTNWASLPKFRSEKWCAAEDKCVNDLLPADDKLSCSICMKATHPDCGNRTDCGIISCHQCSPPGRSIWNCLSNGTWHFDRSDIQSETGKNDQSILTVNTSGEFLVLNSSPTIPDTPLIDTNESMTATIINDTSDLMVLESGLPPELAATTDKLNISGINEDSIINFNTTEIMEFENDSMESKPVTVTPTTEVLCSTNTNDYDGTSVVTTTCYK